LAHYEAGRGDYETCTQIVNLVCHSCTAKKLEFNL